MATAIALDVPMVGQPSGRATPRRSGTALHDALLLAAIALPDLLPSYFFGADPSIGPSDPAALVAYLLPLAVVSLGSGALLLAGARRLIDWRAPPPVTLAAAGALVLATALLRSGVWWVEAGLPDVARGLGIRHPPEAFAILWLYTGLIVGPLVLAYERSRIRRDDAMRRLLALQQAQRQAEQRVAAARVRALHGRVDPLVLSQLLAAVGHAYEHDPARAEGLLDALIAFLRLSTSRTRERHPTLGQELALAGAYQRLRGLSRLPAVALDPLAAEAAGDARFPAGALMALLEDAQQVAGTRTLAVSAGRDSGVLRVDCRLPSVPSCAALSQARALLEDAGGRLAARADGVGWRVTMETPDDPV